VSAENRSVTMERERDNIYRVELQGTLRKTDFQRCQDQLKDEIGRVGPVRLLFTLRRFDGWERGQDWNDLSFFIQHGDNIERIAIVGPEQWRSQTLMFAGADLRRAPVEFFRDDAVHEARTWLSS
jgi:SpoIIAA-like